MKDGWAWTTIILALVVLSSFVFATEGTFQGRIVDPPAKEPAAPGWIFVQGRRHLVRRVDVSKAVIVPIPGAPSSQGKKCGPECLTVGQEVKVTAEQDPAGEWHAKRVEILRPAAAKVPATGPTALPYETLPSQNLGCWITDPGRLRIQPLTEKSTVTRWSGGIMNDVL